MNIEALLLLGTHCPHCASVLEALAELVKKGELSRLEVINLERAPDAAEVLGVRSVPWVRLGPFELAGLHTLEEYRSWIQRADSVEGMASYLAEQLEAGQVERILKLIQQDDHYLHAVFQLLADASARINVKVGLGVILEDLAEKDQLRDWVKPLGELARHDSASVRADACHYLGLSKSPEARDYLEPCLSDESEDVREIAQESLAELAMREA